MTTENKPLTAAEAPAAAPASLGALRLTETEARRRIAEELCWRIEVIPPPSALQGEFRLIAPDGGAHGVYRYEEVARRYLPNWLGDIAAAWPLWEEMRDSSYLTDITGDRDSARGKAPFGKAMDFLMRLSPITICEAWPSWKLNQLVVIVPDGEEGEDGGDKEEG